MLTHRALGLFRRHSLTPDPQPDEPGQGEPKGDEPEGDEPEGDDA